jgi:hypothetical protein
MTKAQQLRQRPHWLNKSWVYIPAASHGDAAAFAERQRERLKKAQGQGGMVRRGAAG